MMEDVNKLLDEIIDSIGEISTQLVNLRALLGKGSGANELPEFFNSDAYARFHAYTEYSYHGKPPSDSDWSELERLFRVAFPRYYQLIAIDHRLTRDQFRLCLLIRLSFSHYVMARIMGVDGMRITRLKIQVNNRLFGVGKAKMLDVNLKNYF